MTASEQERLELRRELLDELREILTEELRVPLAPEQIDPDTILFGSGLALDSVDAVDFAVAIERRRRIRVADSPEGRQALRTLGTLVDELVARSEGREPPRPAPLAFDPSQPLARACEAIRRRVALTIDPAVARVRLRGPAAFDLVDRLSTRDVFIRSGQILHTLFLDAGGRAWADVHAAADDDDFILFVEGPSTAELLATLEAARTPDEPVELLDLEPEWALLDLCGPFAWELMERLVGPEVLGIPYLNFFDLPELDGLAFRMGKTGEYGYQLLVPRAKLEPALDQLRTLGQDFELAEVSDEAVDLCALETGFFSAREPSLRELTPIELQLQWRLSPERAYPGAEALAASRADAGRVRWFRAEPGDGPAPRPGQALFAAGQRVGVVQVARPSPGLARVVGLALLDRAWSLPDLTLDDGEGRPLLTTASPPLVRSLSLYVDPQRHTYASRSEDGLDGLV